MAAYCKLLSTTTSPGPTGYKCRDWLPIQIFHCSLLQAADAAFYVAGFRLPRRFAPRNDEVDADHLVIFVKSIGGSSRSRTGVHGFAGRCITTLPSSQCNEANFSQKNRVKRTFLYPILLRPTLSRIFIGQCFLRGSARPIVIFITAIETWSGKRDSNSRPQPWQGCALPLSYSRLSGAIICR